MASALCWPSADEKSGKVCVLHMHTDEVETDRKVYRYDGEWVCDKLNGVGKLSWSSGDKCGDR